MDVTSTAEASLRRAVDFVPQGLAVFDTDLRLVAWNARYLELLDLPAKLVAAGTALYDIALYVARRGDFGEGDPIQLAAASRSTSGGPTYRQRLVVRRKAR